MMNKPRRKYVPVLGSFPHIRNFPFSYPRGTSFKRHSFGSWYSYQWRRDEFKNGGTYPAQSAENNFLVVPLLFFGYKSTISSFGERFRNGQYSLVSFFFAVLLLSVPPVPSHL